MPDSRPTYDGPSYSDYIPRRLKPYLQLWRTSLVNCESLRVTRNTNPGQDNEMIINTEPSANKYSGIKSYRDSKCS
ncbi:hypothetical protein E2P81_ATG07675 [Venturia nashicola]|nr:hypothetical protein E2P81_ATG07675 [Venturia nashicola]